MENDCKTIDNTPQFTTLPSNPANGPELWSFDPSNPEPPHNATCSRIFDFLYLGGHLAAESVEWLQKMGITCVINVRKVSVQNVVQGVDYMDIEVDDDEYEPIHWFFDDTIAKIESHRAANGRILINCEMGISRSATICLMYMIRCHDRSLRQAYFELKSLRPCIHPNIYFWKNMISYEKRIRNKITVKLMTTGWTRPIPDVYLA